MNLTKKMKNNHIKKNGKKKENLLKKIKKKNQKI